MKNMLLALGAAALLGAALARAVDAFADVSPQRSTIGTQVTAVFEGEVGTKPKIELRPNSNNEGKGPKAKAKLVSSDGHTVVFAIQSAKGSGFFDVGVKGSEEVAGELELARPIINGLDVGTVAAGGTLTISGDFFGELENKRNAPKVYVNGKKARVTAFSDDALTVVLHKKTPAGDAPVRVVNKIGESEYTGELTVTEPPQPVKGKDFISARFGSTNFRRTPPRNSRDPQSAAASFEPGLNRVNLSGGGTSGTPPNAKIDQLLIQVLLGRPIDEVQFPQTYSGSQFFGALFSVTTILPPNTDSYKADSSNAFTVTIDAYDGSRIAGSFSGTMVKVSGNGPATIQVTDGKFVLTLAD